MLVIVVTVVVEVDHRTEEDATREAGPGRTRDRDILGKGEGTGTSADRTLVVHCLPENATSATEIIHVLPIVWEFLDFPYTPPSNKFIAFFLNMAPSNVFKSLSMLRYFKLYFST